ncbi:MAG: ComEC/Rec2 family competence protein, partial [Muribaculaceae bacterium]|nr:ComEC/Rec2 family competence protein [Muribaculaceae bacterium]
MIELLYRMPAVPALIGWAAGILLWFLGCGWWVAAVVAGCGIAMAVWKRYAAMSVLYAMSAGWIVACVGMPEPVPEALLDGREETYAAVVRSVRNTPGALTVVADVDSVAGRPCAPFGVQIASVPEWMPPRVGDVISFVAVLEQPLPTGRYRYAPDYTARYLADGVVATAYIDGDIKVYGHRGGFRAYMAGHRDAMVSMLAHSGLSDEAYGMLSTLITGYTDDLDPGIREGYRVAGIAHALALSGFHVGVVVMLVSLILFPLRFCQGLRRWRMAAGIVAVWIYAFVTGMPDSVLRAVLMLSIYSCGLMWGRNVSPYNTLCSAVLIILALRPYSLFSAGFQLSVCAVLGILVFADKFNPVDRRRHRLHMAVAPLAVACAALVGTMPVTVSVFHRLPLLFLFSNLLVTLALPIIMFGGLLLLVCQYAGVGCGLLCKVLDYVVAALDGTVDAMAGMPGSVLWGIYLTPLQLSLLVAAIAAVGLALHFRRRDIMAVAIMAVALFGSSALWKGEDVPHSEAFVVPMRGNTAIVARHGRTAVATVTCDERFRDNAVAKIERALEHYLAASGVDTLVLTRGDFVVGEYSRIGDMFRAGEVAVALLVGPGRPDSLVESPRYAIVGNRCRLHTEDIVRLIHPDT